ncbi:alpha/beta hydrolase family protein [Actinokineospora iranica]|uniref:Prolyl oligopeptidase family protein n=1 Tax=Actinokineospora iranica TaxID=1271860 RepID=A0A1G6S0Q3_9PSEU|nr:prolyl oligopeptidase family serine peptidase [Actinokineospora iranica]SDD10418.1 Prolyl oligopeptidase family protein [Actinokineospora iranica]
MGERQTEIVSGVAAGVPFTALPPAVPAGGPAPLVLTWHMIDAPRTDAAFAAALPLAGVPAWRVHLGMPLCGARMADGSMDAVVARAIEDAVLSYAAPFVRQAVDELPAALADLRERLPVDDGPIGVVGGSLGGAVALRVLAERRIPVAAAAVVNAAVRARSLVALIEGLTEQPYRWTDEAAQAAADLDFVARSGDIAGGPAQPPLLLVSGEQDYPTFRADTAELAAALRGRYRRPDDVRLITVPDLAHPLAEPPGVEPAPQLPQATAVDAEITAWFRHHLVSSGRTDHTEESVSDGTT